MKTIQSKVSGDDEMREFNVTGTCVKLALYGRYEQKIEKIIF